MLANVNIAFYLFLPIVFCITVVFVKKRLKASVELDVPLIVVNILICYLFSEVISSTFEEAVVFFGDGIVTGKWKSVSFTLLWVSASSLALPFAFSWLGSIRKIGGDKLLLKGEPKPWYLWLLGSIAVIVVTATAYTDNIKHYLYPAAKGVLQYHFSLSHVTASGITGSVILAPLFEEFVYTFTLPFLLKEFFYRVVKKQESSRWIELISIVLPTLLFIGSHNLDFILHMTLTRCLAFYLRNTNYGYWACVGAHSLHNIITELFSV